MGIAEEAKGKVKEKVGELTDDDKLRDEGAAQADKGRAESEAAMHEAKAHEHEREASNS